MKKFMFSWILVLSSSILFAQKANIQSAINYLKESDVANAKKMIDEALSSESTKNNAKAWMLRGIISQAIATPAEIMPQMQFMLNENLYQIDLSRAESLKASNPNAFQDALEAYKKSISLDPKYSKEEMMPLMATLIGIGFNNGVMQMNSSKFADASKSFGQIADMANIDGGKLWKGVAQFDTLFASAKMYQGNCAYQMGNDAEATGILEEALKNPITQNVDAYIMLTEIYERTKDETKWKETMKIAKQKFPNDKRIINNEINFYLNSGKTDELIGKLKEAITADPNKIDLHLILGQTYYSTANPTDKTGKSLPRPANAKELESNALNAYNKALDIEPNNAYANFYKGIFFYNQAKEVNDVMNQSDDKKYTQLKPERDNLLNQSLPFLEKARSIIEANPGKDGGFNEMLKQTLSGIMQSYMILGNEAKSNEAQQALNKVK